MAKRTGIKSVDVVIQDPEGPGMITSIQRLCKKNLEKYWDSIKAYQTTAINKKVVVNLSITIDCGNGDPKLDVGIKASQCFKDKLSGTVTDPLQGTMVEIEAEVDGATTAEEEQEEEDKEPANA